MTETTQTEQTTLIECIGCGKTATPAEILSDTNHTKWIIWHHQFGIGLCRKCPHQTQAFVDRYHNELKALASKIKQTT